MSKKLQVISLVSILSMLLVLASCKKVDIEFGQEYVESDFTRIVKIDTFGAQISTVHIDSFTTSGKGVGLLGNYQDPYFGKVEASTYFQIAPVVYEDIYQNTSFDSMTLILKLNHSFYGDTTKPLTINVNRLSTGLILPTGQTAFYNTSEFAANTALGARTFTIAPRRDDSLAIRLDVSSPALAQEFYGMLKRKSDTIKNSAIFLDYFKGIKLSSPSLPSGIVIGISDSVLLRIHYKKSGAVGPVNKTIDFNVVNNNLQFSHIDQDRSGTPIAALNGTTVKSLSSESTGGTAYLQTLSSTMVKIKFPSLRKILNLPDYRKILKAQLVIRPIKGSYNSTIYQLPPELRLNLTNVLNQFGTAISLPGANGQPVTQTGNLSIDYLYGESTNYVYDVTEYLKYAITDVNVIESGLLLTPPSPGFETTFNRIVVGDRYNTQGKIELQIYYAAIQ